MYIYLVSQIFPIKLMIIYDLVFVCVLTQCVRLFAKTQSPGWHPKAARRFGASLFPRILQALHHPVMLAALRQDV